MDNRATVVQMKPRNRKRVIVSTDLVTGGLQGYNTDNFNLGNVVKGIGSLAGATGIPGLSQAGNIAANAINNSQAKKASKNAGVSTVGTFMSDWEGKLLRDKSDPAGPVYLIKNGVPIHQTSLTKDQWATVTDVMSLPSQGSLQKVTSVTPMISPIMPSVPVTPADANILAAVKASQNSGNGVKTLAEQLTDYVSQLPNSEIQAIKNKAQSIFNSGTNGILTDAQKKLQSLSTSILPKTKAVKDAESILTAPQFGGAPTGSGSSLSFSNPWVLGSIAVVVVVIVILVMKKK